MFAKQKAPKKTFSEYFHLASNRLKFGVTFLGGFVERIATENRKLQLLACDAAWSL